MRTAEELAMELAKITVEREPTAPRLIGEYALRVDLYLLVGTKEGKEMINQMIEIYRLLVPREDS